jgi:alpha-beta hydrolase superfamily lysophospholipase
MASRKSTIFVKTVIILEAVLKILRGRYSKFILWGRSMGAVSALLYTITYNNPEDVILLVLDSPFSSFEVITKELAMRKVKVPSFMISLLLDLVKANFKRMSHDPF